MAERAAYRRPDWFTEHVFNRLVAPRGETQWVRNLRVSRGGELRVGRRRQQFTAEEVGADDDKIAVLRAYLKRWKWEVGAFFEGVGPNSSEAEIRAEGRHHPVFRVQMTT